MRRSGVPSINDITLPTPTTEGLYIKSVNKTVDSYKAQLTTLRHDRNHIDLPNVDFDTGMPTKPEEYKLADQTYAKLVEKLAVTSISRLQSYRPTS